MSSKSERANRSVAEKREQGFVNHRAVESTARDTITRGYELMLSRFEHEREAFSEFAIPPPALHVVLKLRVTMCQWHHMVDTEFLTALQLNGYWPSNPFQILGTGDVERFHLQGHASNVKRGFVILQKGPTTRALFGTWRNKRKVQAFLMHGDAGNPSEVEHMRNRTWLLNAYCRYLAELMREPRYLWKQGDDYVVRKPFQRGIKAKT